MLKRALYILSSRVLKTKGQEHFLKFIKTRSQLAGNIRKRVIKISQKLQQIMYEILVYTKW